MSAYNVGITLIMIKLIQYLIEILFEVEFPPILSIVLLGLLGSGVTLIIIDLLVAGVTPWLSVPMIIIIAIVVACLIRLEITSLNNHNRDK